MKPPESGPKRAAARFSAVLPAVMRLDGRDFPCSADNLSRQGVLLLGNLPEPDRPDVEVTITTPAQDRKLDVVGRVAHYRPGDAEAGSARLGLYFGELTREQCETLDLLVSRVVEGMAPGALQGLDESTPLGELRAKLAKIPVAHRVILAARAKPLQRKLLLKDTDPQVLEALARNPNIVLPEIKSLLRRAELLPSTLEVIAEDVRWKTDDEVKIQIATHPRVTFTTADKVVAKLNDLTIQKLLRRPGLQPGVKQKLMVKLSRKHRGG